MILLTKQEALVRPLPFVFGLIIAIIIGVALSISGETLARTGISPVFVPDFLLFLHIPFDDYFVRVTSIFSQQVLFFSLMIGLIQLIGIFLAVKGRLANYQFTSKQLEFLAERRIDRNTYLIQSICLCIFSVIIRYGFLYSCFKENSYGNYSIRNAVANRAISHILPLLFMLSTSLSIIMATGVFLTYFYYFRDHGRTTQGSAF